MDYAKHSTAADVWAFGTTLWEIFQYGIEMKSPTDHLKEMQSYVAGKRLLMPEQCPKEFYILMQQCWDADPHRRIKPQTIVRDIKQIMYQGLFIIIYIYYLFVVLIIDVYSSVQFKTCAFVCENLSKE